MVLGLGLMVWSAEVMAQEPITTAFTYQGFLMDQMTPAQRQYDFEFRLFDDYNDIDGNLGQQVGQVISAGDLNVVDGHFTLALDFGRDVFTGQRRWLQTAIRRSGTGNPFTALTPPLEVTLTPYALYALYAEDANNANEANTLDGFHADNLPYIDGGGTANRIPLFTDANTLADGTEGQGRVLTSDAAGVATWQPLPASGVGRGMILMWSGATNEIPSGWALCDGQVHDGTLTPDLRDRFIVGAGGTYDVNETGGEALHTLTIAEMPSHSHPGLATEKRVGDADAHDYDMFKCQPAGASGAAGGDQPHENRPPYYALAYVMKTGN